MRPASEGKRGARKGTAGHRGAVELNGVGFRRVAKGKDSSRGYRDDARAPENATYDLFRIPPVRRFIRGGPGLLRGCGFR